MGAFASRSATDEEDDNAATAVGEEEDIDEEDGDADDRRHGDDINDGNIMMSVLTKTLYLTKDYDCDDVAVGMRRYEDDENVSLKMVAMLNLPFFFYGKRFGVDIPVHRSCVRFHVESFL